jgi:uncharacterized protein YukE
LCKSGSGLIETTILGPPRLIGGKTTSPAENHTRIRNQSGTRDFTGRVKTNTIKVIRSDHREESRGRRDVLTPGRRHFPFQNPAHVAESRPEMSQAIVNPEELRRFAARLKQFNNEMISQLTTLHGQLAGLSQTWRDREHDKFVEQFEQTLQVVKRFTESTNQHIPFLLRKAERIEEYLQQR